MKKKNWYLLDNAGKIFPSVSNKNRPNMFTVGFEMADMVDPVALQEAIDIVIQRFPSYKVRLKRGLFWYYLEENLNKLVVKEIPSQLFSYDILKQNNGFLFELAYLNKTIRLTIFHALTDGTGAMEFLKSITYQYLKILGKEVESDGIIMMPSAPSTNREVKDSFLEYYDKNKSTLQEQKKAFHIEGTHFDHGGVGVIKGTVSVEEVKKIAKQHGATLTTFLASVYAYAIYKENYIPDKPSKKPIAVFIPVNIRKLFNDVTTRNFAGLIGLQQEFEPDVTLDKIINSFKEQMKEKTERDYIINAINSNVKIEKNIFLRMAPLCIKDIGMRIGYSLLGDKIQTGSLSNLGAVTLPTSMDPFVEEAFFELGSSYNIAKSLGVISYKDNLTMTFCRSVVDTNEEKMFFRELASMGIKVKIKSNFWEKQYETL